jgi:hypothetical protein
MAYIICSNCGAKALIVASRCPSCQHPFPSREERERASAPVRKQAPKAPWFILGLVVLLGAGGWIAWSTKKKADADKLAAAAQIIPVEPLPDTTTKAVPATADTMPMAMSTNAQPGGAVGVPAATPTVSAPVSTPSSTPVKPPAQPTPQALAQPVVKNVIAGDAPPAVAAPGPPGPDVVWERAVAITAVNVREKPDRASKALIVLVPDDVVMLGDAITGWRRIRVDGMNGWVDPRHFEIRPRKR